ncbi:hypothetical protein [Streptomyces sp. NBC_00120]|uniref:hypothetical protein n=1 Tax=Streptomyces sp. NBC_00120 TaxID=2975660 RepID=UPI002255BBDE|nr:hypothetical protein [Streptomyces sp. NBC_00120]MCX5326318.1 hypothetical protein [Streptomyces sp. NBC_00120]
MGAVLEPTAAMKPWYDVEVRRESAYVTASLYNRGSISALLGEGELTDEHKAAAWHIADDVTTIAPSPVQPLVAALEQIVEHPNYEKWRQEAAIHEGSAGVQLDEGRLLVRAPNSYRYGPTDGSTALSTVEFAYEDLAPLLVVLRRLAGD